jgi:KaiC/GvpD/RAD55 family RecA-like ATPase
MPTRLVFATSRTLLDRMVEHIHALHKEDRSVLLVTTRDPASVLLRRFKDGGVNLDRLFIIDAVGMRAGAEWTNDPDHLMYVATPNQLELIAMRAQKVIRQKAEGTPHVVLSTVNSFALYNAPEALEEVMRYTLHNLVRPTAWMDFVIEEDAPLDASLRGFLDSFIDGRAQLGDPAAQKP